MLQRFLRRGLPPEGFHTVVILVAIAVGLVGLRLTSSSAASRADLFYPSGRDAGASQAPSPSVAAAADGSGGGVDPSGANAAGVGLTATAPAVPPNSPMRVVIPAIGVSSGLVRLGMNPDRTVQVPSSYGTAGWYTGSGEPGSVGKPAVILGHVDSTSGPAVFFRLKTLKPGDTVWVLRSDGSWIRFQVNTVAEYPKSRFPTSLVYGPQPGATLRLITCGGAFDYATGHYLDNIVVFATLA